MKLITERLAIREYGAEDIDDIVRYLNNLNVSKYLLTVPYPYTKKDAEWWINDCRKKRRERPRKDYNLAILLKAERRVIGGISLSKVKKDQGTAEIGYCLEEDYWRQGYTTEATTTLIDFAFKKLKLRRIESHIYTENEASQELAKSLRFRYEGTKRKAVKVIATGKIHDVMVYGLLREEWK